MMMMLMVMMMILCVVVVMRPVTLRDLRRSLIAVKPRPLTRLRLLHPVELHRLGAYYCTPRNIIRYTSVAIHKQKTLFTLHFCCRLTTVLAKTRNSKLHGVTWSTVDVAKTIRIIIKSLQVCTIKVWNCKKTHYVCSVVVHVIRYGRYIAAILLDFYRASICEGGLGSRNSVRLSVCHTRAL